VLARQSNGTLTASSTGFQGSGRLLSMSGANGLVILPHGQGDFETGATVDALLVGRVGSEGVAETAPIQGI